MRANDIPHIERMSVEEKILLAEDLWDNISSQESYVSVPESHISELEARHAKHKSEPGKLLTLDELKSKIESRI